MTLKWTILFFFNLEVCDLVVYCVNWIVLIFLVLKVSFLLPQSDLANVHSLVCCLPRYLNYIHRTYISNIKRKLFNFYTLLLFVRITSNWVIMCTTRLPFTLSYSSRPKSLKDFIFLASHCGWITFISDFESLSFETYL